MDLLTVVIHELGHVMGLEHDAEDGRVTVMDATLDTGVRVLPAADAVVTSEKVTGAKPIVFRSAPEALHLAINAPVSEPPGTSARTLFGNSGLNGNLGAVPMIDWRRSGGGDDSEMLPGELPLQPEGRMLTFDELRGTFVDDESRGAEHRGVDGLGGNGTLDDWSDDWVRRGESEGGGLIDWNALPGQLGSLSGRSAASGDRL